MSYIVKKESLFLQTNLYPQIKRGDLVRKGKYSVNPVQNFGEYSTFHIEIKLDNLLRIYIMIYTLQDTVKLYERRGG